MQQANTLDLQTTDTRDLKATAYDTLAAIEHYQNNLKMINEEIFRRNQAQAQTDQAPAATEEETK